MGAGVAVSTIAGLRAPPVASKPHEVVTYCACAGRLPGYQSCPRPSWLPRRWEGLNPACLLDVALHLRFWLWQTPCPQPCCLASRSAYAGRPLDVSIVTGWFLSSSTRSPFSCVKFQYRPCDKFVPPNGVNLIVAGSSFSPSAFAVCAIPSRITGTSSGEGPGFMTTLVAVNCRRAARSSVSVGTRDPVLGRACLCASKILAPDRRTRHARR